jgi:hypothetical protein
LVARLRALQEKPAAVVEQTSFASAPPSPQPAPANTPAQPAPAQSAPHSITPVRPSTVAPPSAVAQERDRPAAAAVAELATRGASAPAPQLGSLLDAGIAKLGALSSAPLIAPVPLPEQPAVPIDVLLYRGRAALERCLEIRDQVRSAGGPVDAETLGELFDLLDLALID